MKGKYYLLLKTQHLLLFFQIQTDSNTKEFNRTFYTFLSAIKLPSECHKLIYRHPLPQLIRKGVIPVVFERTDKLVGRANTME